MKALVLAGGLPQIALIQELKRRGYEVLLADYNENPIARSYADHFFQVSTLDVPAITELARSERVDFLITACTDQALLTVAKVSETLSLPCYIDYQTALNVTNKSYMKKVFEENGIPTAKHVVMGALDMQKIEGMRYPVIVKPVDCNSSKGVRKCWNEAELRDAFDDAVRMSRTDTALVEEFIQGPEVSVDVYVEEGKAHVLAATYSDKIPEDDKFVIFRTRYPIGETEGVVKQIKDTVQRIADAFGLKNSPMLVQMISDGERVYVLEFSARTGGCVKYVLAQMAANVDVISAVVDLTLGKLPKIDIRPAESAYISNVFVYCRPGRFDHLEGFEELKREGILRDYFLLKWKGAQMSNATNSGDRIAAFVLQADTLEELQQKYNRVVDNVHVIDEEGNDIMRRDLLAPMEYKV